MDYKERIKDLPNSPGVYIMKDFEGRVLYIGKAKDLRKRVSSHFQPNRRVAERMLAVISKVEEISYIPTSTCAEALIYENSLIKQLSPKYNVALRDDKSYPLLKLTINEKFPRLLITRQRKPDGSVYYGPYTSAKLLREALGALRQMFPLRTCVRMRNKTCLNYHIGQCPGPCGRYIDEARYNEVVSEVRLFLEGHHQELLKSLAARMKELAKEEKFEEAERLKNRIEALGAIKERKIIYTPASETEELKDLLDMESRPDRIEAFDVSNIMGKLATGSMIYFYKGRPKKSEYRRFRIKTVFKIDDYGMIRELISRRYRRSIDEKKVLPDLILIDGGKGHLSAASGELEKLGLAKIPVIAIAKNFEHIYTRKTKDPVVLPASSKALHLVERIRDEAHRFAVSYHKRLYTKNIEVSELDNIKGIGPKRRKALMNYFGSTEGVKLALYEELLKVKGMDEKSAKNVIEYFRGENP